MSEQARLIVAAVGYWLVVCLIVAVIACTISYVTYRPPDAPAACIVSETHECTAETISGPYTLYYVPWGGGYVGIASPTPKEGTP